MQADRDAPLLFGVFAWVMVASFALALYWTDVAAPWAFFSLPTRAWQLGVGALIAIGVLKLPRGAPGWLAQGSFWRTEYLPSQPFRKKRHRRPGMDIPGLAGRGHTARARRASSAEPAVSHWPGV